MSIANFRSISSFGHMLLALHAFFDQLRQCLILGAGFDIPADLVHRQVPCLGFLDLHAVIDAQNAVIRVAEGGQSIMQ